MKIDGHETIIYPYVPNDAGVIQKTFFKGTQIPVFILAGLGTTGTEVTGLFLSKYFIDLGKLYGSNSFCVMLRTDITKGETFYEVEAMYPKPAILRRILYPITFNTWKRKKVFPN